MQKLKNQAMLITYADSMAGNLKKLNEILDRYFDGVICGVHVLPFYPSSGDHGFAVIDYDSVDTRYGDWNDIRRLSEKYYLMADFMVNHISVRSVEFQDYLCKGEESSYKDMFIHWNEFWPEKAPNLQEKKVLFQRKSQEPYIDIERKDNTIVRLWNTFFSEQIDISPFSPVTQAYYERNLTLLAKYVPIIRLDALAYATKRPGTSCFFVEPELWDILKICQESTGNPETLLLSEIHSDYKKQLRLAEKGYWVYDFALPALLLHGLFTESTDILKNWLEICPRKQFTTLDTHDGIGLIDVEGLLSESQIEYIKSIVNSRLENSLMTKQIEGTSVRSVGTKAKQYQLMGTYYSALGEDDEAYLLARVVQLYAPGIPQIYYGGLLAATNDVAAMQTETDIREINRHKFTQQDIEECLQKPIVKSFCEILRFRNSYSAFNGEFSLVTQEEDGLLQIVWKKERYWTTLRADFHTRRFSIEYVDECGTMKVLEYD